MTLDQQIAAVAREIAMRRNVYPKWVSSGRMKQAQADHEIAAMEAVIETLKAERWIPVAERLPDDEVTVFAALDGSSEPVWLAYHSTEEGWFSADGEPIKVTHWKPMSAGPT